MGTKIITPTLREALSALTPTVIPPEYRHQVILMGIKDIYLLKNSELKDFGVSCDVVVVFQNDEYLDLQTTPQKVESVIQYLYYYIIKKK